MSSQITEENVHHLLEGHGFQSSRDTFLFVVGWMFLSLDANTAPAVPRFLVTPDGRTPGDPFEFIVIPEAQATALGIDSVMLAQGANRDEAQNWLEANPEDADEMFVIAAAVYDHGSVSESPIPKPLLEFPGGREAFEKLKRPDGV